MPVRIIREKGLSTVKGGGSLSVSSDGKTLTIEYPTSFRHMLSRPFAEQIPLPGVELPDQPDASAMTFDVGGIRLEYYIEFVKRYDNETDLYNDYSDIYAFFGALGTLERVWLEVDELGWTGDNKKSVVVRQVDLEYRGGEALIIRGRITLLGGQSL